MKLYKLTDKLGKANGLQWGKNITHTVSTEPNTIPAYWNLNLALLTSDFNKYNNPPMVWVADGKVVKKPQTELGYKLFIAGCDKITTVKQISLPIWYIDDELRCKVAEQFVQACLDTAFSAARTVTGMFDANKIELYTNEWWTLAYTVQAAQFRQYMTISRDVLFDMDILNIMSSVIAAVVSCKKACGVDIDVDFGEIVDKVVDEVMAEFV